MIIIKATFTRTDSLSYKKGKEYELALADFGGTTIRRVDCSNEISKCVYHSLSAFFRNWNNISIIK
jgi:hypothetical protein